MKPREFKLNFAISDELNVMRLHGYIRRYINPNYVPQTRFQRQHLKPSARHFAVTRKRYRACMSAKAL